MYNGAIAGVTVLPDRLVLASGAIVSRWGIDGARVARSRGSMALAQLGVGVAFFGGMCALLSGACDPTGKQGMLGNSLLFTIGGLAVGLGHPFVASPVYTVVIRQGGHEHTIATTRSRPDADRLVHEIMGMAGQT